MVTNLPSTAPPLLYPSWFSPWKASKSVFLRPCNQGKLAWAQSQSVFFLHTFYITLPKLTFRSCSLKQWFSALIPKSFSRMKLQKEAWLLPGCLLVWSRTRFTLNDGCSSVPTSCVHGQNDKWPLGFFLYGNLPYFLPLAIYLLAMHICIFICFTSQ